MFKVTPAAAAQIKDAVEKSNADGLALRIAARQMDDGGIDYTMGFDERQEEDVLVEADGVAVIHDVGFQTLLNDTTLDFVELEDGKSDFIFIDPANLRHKSES